MDRFIFAYLLYYYPKEVSKHGQVIFNVEPHRVKTNIKAAESVVRDALKCLTTSLNTV